MANVCVSLAGISLRNPTVLVAGIMGTNAELLCRVGKCGAGAVTGISCSLEPRSGAVNPCLLELGGALLNCVGLANPGVEAYCIELSKAVGASDVPVFGSVAGSSVEEFGLLAERVAAAGVVAVELNLGAHSCFGRRVWNLEEIGKVVEGVKSRVKKPVFVKLAPSLGLVDNAMVAEAAGADAITAVHSFGPGMVIDVESGTPVLSSRA
ncbi:TPA: dihydroorotate dehydrogenase, partial [Candidatus Micrarchaeota archaeon]|nr:dihydroorotate dehydrogenase [Candidatus Micrarchaeota archaeon]